MIGWKSFFFFIFSKDPWKEKNPWCASFENFHQSFFSLFGLRCSSSSLFPSSLLLFRFSREINLHHIFLKMRRTVTRNTVFHTKIIIVRMLWERGENEMWTDATFSLDDAELRLWKRKTTSPWPVMPRWRKLRISREKHLLLLLSDFLKRKKGDEMLWKMRRREWENEEEGSRKVFCLPNYLLERIPTVPSKSVIKDFWGKAF